MLLQGGGSLGQAARGLRAQEQGRRPSLMTKMALVTF